MRELVWVLACVGSVGCTQGSAVAVRDEERALAISREYLGYGRIDDELRWAPDLCRIPLPGVARLSTSDDPQTHGAKLFSLLVKDRAGYPADSKVGQVVVKESYAAELVSDGTFSFDPEGYRFDQTTNDHFYPYANKDEKIYRAGAPLGLYLMYRAEAGADSDEGWLYAVVTPDRQVAAAGKVEACANCHRRAPFGRLFGVSAHY